ncbi:efflux RND transporter periplasmic adaptor subunit, partial [Candidatus Aerophobetes bacterium]|nr:efflux RND transporter periplasmic adaptor subunit [Candidatus Aerophobetes bacterium]
MKGKRKVFLVVVAGIIVVAGVSFVYKFVFSADENNLPPDLSLQTIAVQRGDIIETVSATGSIIAHADIDIEAKKSGAIIEELLVEEGEYVREGQILVRLEDDEERLSVLEAENALEDALLELESAKLSHAPPSEIKRKEREVAEKKLVLELAKKKLEETVIKAPFSGIISEIYVEKGEVIAGVGASSSNKILRLIDTSRLFAEVNVDEVDIAKVKLGQRANVKTDAYPDEIFTGKVVSIGREAETSEGLVVVKVKIELDRPDSRLKPGFTASADIIVGEAKNAIILPVEEVRKREGRYFVTVLQNGKPVPREVEVGVSDGTYIEIKKGLKEEDIVVATGLKS